MSTFTATPDDSGNCSAMFAAMDKAGEIDQLWAKWLGPNTEYKIVREEKVTPLAELKFTPLP